MCSTALWDTPPDLKKNKKNKNQGDCGGDQGGVYQSAAKHPALTIFNHKNYNNDKLFKILI